MTYNKRPLYGIKQQFFGPADYAQAQFQQKIKPQPIQSMAVGNSAIEQVIEGYEKPKRQQYGSKQELMGSSAISIAQASVREFEIVDESKRVYLNFDEVSNFSILDIEGDGTPDNPFNITFEEWFSTQRIGHDKTEFEEYWYDPQYNTIKQSAYLYQKIDNQLKRLTKKEMQANWGKIDLWRYSGK